MMSAGLWPGKMRQLMLASACCGRAFSAWPPDTMVATQVVPIWPTRAGSARRVAMAWGSSGLVEKARMAAEILGSASYFDASAKEPRVLSVEFGLEVIVV